MRVGIEASYLLTPEKSGVETYALNLIRGLLSLADRPALHLYAAGTSPVPPEAAELLTAATRARYSPASRLWLRARAPAWMLWERVEVAHFPGTILPPWLPCPAVTTFYDLACSHYPELYAPEERALYDRVIPSAARRSRVVLAISEATKRDLTERYGVPANKIVVTPLGVDPSFAPVPEAVETVRQRFGIDTPYLLACVGSGHPRKNLKAVVHAFGELGRRDLSLAIVGSANRDREALAAIEECPARDRVAILDHVAEADLPAIYSAATLFCFPSLHEGFGLPVLESMACGTPVVCSNTSSLPEVAGEAAVTIAPTDLPALTDAIAAILDDSARQSALATAGEARSRQFTWKRTAEATMQAYRRAVEG